MKFCPKCGAMLVQKTKNLGCPRCGYSSKEKEKLSSSEKIKDHKEIAVIKKEVNTAPVTTKKCLKCGNNQAYFWSVQTRAADEAETKFFKCTKCGKTTKEYR